MIKVILMKKLICPKFMKQIYYISHKWVYLMILKNMKIEERSVVLMNKSPKEIYQIY